MTPAPQRIHPLPPHIAAQIAAGEVIDRPATALKELLENALDAGAQRLAVDIADGGAGLMRVTDDGAGIAAADLALAFERHATSKIRAAADLAAIASYGFRGEALASLAAVSDITLRARPPDSPHGWEYLPAAPADPKPHPMARGTDITARQLFANVPARRRFMRRSATEAAHCTAAVTHAAISAPHIAFTYAIDGKTRFALPAGQTLAQRLQSLYPPLADNLLPIAASSPSLRIDGYLFAPALHNSGKRIGQFTYVNGRVVRDSLLRRAILDALRPMTHDGEGGYAIFLQIDSASVDVNVHPAKLEVRFSDPGAVFGFLRRAIGMALAAPLALPSRDTPPPPPQFQDAATATAPPLPSAAAAARQWLPHPAPAAPPRRDWRKILADTDTAPPPTNDTPAPPPALPSDHPVTAFDDHPLGRALGQMHDIYILAENRRGLVVIDMHAAHERILYEELKTSADRRDLPMQSLLIPLQLALNDTQAATLREHADQLIGIAADLIDDHTARITAVGSLIAGNADPGILLTDILHDIADGGAGDHATRARDRILSTVACHAAARAKRRLNAAEMDSLLRQMEKVDRSGACNHGRPCWQQIDRTYFDRVFKRGK